MLHLSIDHIPPAAQGCVVAIGNFDGVHLGHQALIKKARDIAHAARVPLGVLTFEPHPRHFFQPSSAPFRLTLLPTKARLLKEFGADHVFALKFDDELSLLTGEEFIDKILVGKLKAKHVVVGADFAFGRARSGTVETLKKAAAAGKFHLDTMSLVTASGGMVCSSTAIRDLLRQGNFAGAEKMLGHPWMIETQVVEGDKRGRELGFPTANQNVPDYVRVPYGIYAVKAQIEGENKWHDGVANFGIRPMFEIAQPIFETFIFDFNQEIYGKVLRVRPVQFLRPERSFKDLEALKAQMKEDCIAAEKVLKSTQIL